MIERLYGHYYEELLRWCTGMTENVQTAEELIQEAFLRAISHERLLETMQERQRRAWLYQTVKHLYVDRVRHLHREMMTGELPEPVKESEEMGQSEWKLLLESLPEPEGAIFAMRYLEGYHSGEIGEIFGIPAGTVRFRLSSARKHIKEILGGNKDVG